MWLKVFSDVLLKSETVVAGTRQNKGKEGSFTLFPKDSFHPGKGIYPI